MAPLFYEENMKKIKLYLKILMYKFYMFFTFRRFLHQDKIKLLAPTKKTFYSSHDKRKLQAVKSLIKKGNVTHSNLLHLLALEVIDANSEEDIEKTKEKLIQINKLTIDWLSKL
jgi:hypothetical protein